MELPTKLLEQIAFKTRLKIEEHLLVVMDISVHEEHLYQPLQTKHKPFKCAITFSTAYNGIFNVTSTNIKFYFLKSVTDEDGYIQSTIPPGANEIGSLDNEITRIVIDQDLYTGANYPFQIKPNFSTLESIIEIFTSGPIIIFEPDDSIGDLLGFNKTTKYEEYNLSSNLVETISFDIEFLETDIARDMIF